MARLRRASICGWLLAVVLLLSLPAGGAAQVPVAEKCEQPDAAETARLLASEMTCMINEVRETRDLHRLRVNSQLRRTATTYARRLVRSRDWTHFGDGSPADRVRRSGYLDGSRKWVVGEVLASMREWDPAGVLQAFLDSPSHRRVLLRPGYRDIGVGAVEGLPRSDAAGGYTLAVNLGER